MTSEHDFPENKGEKKNDNSCLKNCYCYLPIIKHASLAAGTVKSHREQVTKLTVFSYLNLSEYKEVYIHVNAASNRAFPLVMKAYLSLLCNLNVCFQRRHN
jgi:hypothetical protein